MKRFGKSVFCIIMTVCMLFGLFCTFASARSSAYLDGYSATVTPQSGGKMAVTVDVSGVEPMTQIGATKIYIYESKDNVDFTQVASYKYEDYPKMMSSGMIYYDTPVTYSGKPGYYYLASVYCYAGKDGGGTERNYTTSSKKAIR